MWGRRVRLRCNVPGCAGVIEGNSAQVPCPECVKRFEVMPRLQEQIKSLQAQLIELQASRLNGRILPVLVAVGKKPSLAKDLATSLKRSRTTISTALLKLEKRGLVIVAEYRRLNGRAIGNPVWKLSPLGERLVHEKSNGGVK